jgi:hypothetical protein
MRFMDISLLTMQGQLARLNHKHDSTMNELINFDGTKSNIHNKLYFLYSAQRISFSNVHIPRAVQSNIANL